MAVTTNHTHAIPIERFFKTRISFSPDAIEVVQYFFIENFPSYVPKEAISSDVRIKCSVSVNLHRDDDKYSEVFYKAIKAKRTIRTELTLFYKDARDPFCTITEDQKRDDFSSKCDARAIEVKIHKKPASDKNAYMAIGASGYMGGEKTFYYVKKDSFGEPNFTENKEDASPEDREILELRALLILIANEVEQAIQEVTRAEIKFAELGYLNDPDYKTPAKNPVQRNAYTGKQ